MTPTDTPARRMADKAAELVGIHTDTPFPTWDESTPHQQAWWREMADAHGGHEKPAEPKGMDRIDAKAAVDDAQAKHPKIMAALHESELAGAAQNNHATNAPDYSKASNAQNIPKAAK